ncbi:MAG TPA: DUF4157 domain-containing protein [Sphingomicrobium sp.]
MFAPLTERSTQTTKVEQRTSLSRAPLASVGRACAAPTREGGEPLDQATLNWSRRAFDHDFSRVRVHRTEAAARAAAHHGANGFAVGNDIYLGDGHRDLAGGEGRTLLAHELAHVVQQRHRRIDNSRVEPVDSPAEREAHHAAAQVMAGGHALALRHAPMGIPRDVGWARRGPIPDPFGMGYNEILGRAGAGAEPAVRDLASLEGADLKVDRAKFNALAPDRRTAVLSLDRHAKGTGCEGWFTDLALSSGGGDFTVPQYDVIDGDPGKDTKKQCGIDITINFTPAKSLRSDQISFVQIMKFEIAGTPILLPNEKARGTTAAQGDAGWAVDRFVGFKNPEYGVDDAGKEKGNTTFGYRKSDTDFKVATMTDKLRGPRDVGQTMRVQATAFALDKTNSKYLGGLAWGLAVDAKGVATKPAAMIHSIGAPAGIQKTALEQWNVQAKDPDVSKRNAPAQAPVTVP